MACASRLLVAVLFSALVTVACGRAPSGTVDTLAPVAAAQAEVESVVAPAAASAQREVAQVLVPAVLEVQAAVQELAAAAPPGASTTWAGAEVATALIIRWEIGSPELYARKWEGVICPGGISGPTIGVGYDLGHQTSADIRSAWAEHPDVERLASASGVVGDTACRTWAATHRDIRTDFPFAERVFLAATLPAYHAAAARALDTGWESLSPHAQAGLTSLGYNRGWSMRGDRNREKRSIRDDCAPVGDADCVASQLRAMKRLWPTVRGLRDRREDEARTVERTS